MTEEHEEYEMVVELKRTIKDKNPKSAVQHARKIAHDNFGEEFQEPHFELDSVRVELKE